jgi:hypothetical protein
MQYLYMLDKTYSIFINMALILVEHSPMVKVYWLCVF